MQDTTEEKQAKDFTLMRIKLFLFIIASIGILQSCENAKNNPSNIPNVPVNLTINLDLPLYQNLNFIGQYVYESGGNKGIVIIHHTDGNYYAIERTCSYEPLEQCNLIEVNEAITRLRCGVTQNDNFIPCCGSEFFLDGQVIQGPAQYPLKHYNVRKSGSYLYISN